MSADLAHLQNYARVMEALRGDNLETLQDVTTDDVEFKDPFSHHHSRDDMVVIFRRMFDRLPDIRMEVEDFGVAANSPNTGFLLWRMFDTSPGTKAPLTLEGTSIVTFNDQGKVVRHIDHWDASSQFYERFPVIGPMIRFVKKRV